MKRLLRAVVLLMPLAFCVVGCKKAHDAGNDSMKASGGPIQTSASAAVSAGPAAQH